MWIQHRVREYGFCQNNSVISFSQMCKFDRQRWKYRYTIHVLLWSTWVHCLRHLYYTSEPVQPCGLKCAEHGVSDLQGFQYARNGNRGPLPEHLRNSPGWDLAWAASPTSDSAVLVLLGLCLLPSQKLFHWGSSAKGWGACPAEPSQGHLQCLGASVSVGSHSAGRDPSAQGNGRFWVSCIEKTPGNSHLSLQPDRAEEHHAQWELTGRGTPGKRRLQSTSSAKLTLLFFPPLSFDIKQTEWVNGRCRHN